MIDNGKVALYYGRKDVLSSHYPCSFWLKKRKFNCVEQVIMYCKAVLFDDIQTAIRVMNSTDPVEMFLLGRNVEEYVEVAWAAKRIPVFLAASYAKFSQNKELLEVLLGTGNMILGEASPTNKYWGTGLSKADERAFDPTCWKGKNVHGYSTMEIREKLRLELYGKENP